MVKGDIGDASPRYVWCQNGAIQFAVSIYNNINKFVYRPLFPYSAKSIPCNKLKQAVWLEQL